MTEPPRNFVFRSSPDMYVNKSATIAFAYGKSANEVQFFIYGRGWTYIKNEEYERLKSFIEFL